jgi:hypothetical protein
VNDHDWARDEVLVSAKRLRCPLTNADAICVVDAAGGLVRVVCGRYDPRSDTCAAKPPAAAGPIRPLGGVLDCQLAARAKAG